MTEPADIYRSAWIMHRHYGDMASAEAERRARDMRNAGDSKGEAFWRRVAAAMGELIDESNKEWR